MNQINNGYRQAISNRIFVDFELYSLGNYYNELDDKYKSDDMPSLMDYILSKARLLNNLDALQKSSEYIHSVYYINYEKQIVFTSGYMQYPLTGFYDSESHTGIAKLNTGYPIIMDTRDSKQSDGTTLRVLPVVFQPIASNYSVIINLDVKALEKNLISKLSEGETKLAVFSRNGSLLFYDSDPDSIALMETVRYALATTAVDNQNHSEVDSVNHNKLLIAWKTSSVFGWKVASVTELNKLYQSATNLQLIFWVILIALILVIGALMPITSRNMYKPIFRLLHYIKSDEPHMQHRSTGEFQLIRESLTDAYEARKNLQLRLKESFPAYQEKFVRSLLRIKSLDLSKVRERLTFFGLDLKPEGIALLLVSIENNDKWKSSDIESSELKHLLIRDAISDSIDPPFKRLVMELSEGCFIVLMNCGDMSETFTAAYQIKHKLFERHGFECTLGIGGYCDTMGDIPRSYKEAEEALSYRNMAGGSEVIYIEDIRLESKPSLTYPKEKEASLIVYIKNGDGGQALRIFDDMVEDFSDFSIKVPFSEVQQVFLILLVRLMETARELQIDIKELELERTPLITTFLEKNDWNEIVKLFKYIILTMALQIGDAFHRKNNKHVEQALEIIESSHYEEVSLTSVAERLKLNPAYLSRIFKEHTGSTFTDYITLERIRMSKGLLLRTELQVQEISKQLGYMQVSYFIKLFKTVTGVTPNEYRKNYKQFE
ncbi:helix-turn-helix domain-containing protein [Paenibacillus sp. HJGM_3]|uniref:helix-turn-helix domain-containing protein n=1 Tax=Paenibacillus sp. HJGM_3 TaxID=3379816 RepID=UPI0038594198